MKNSKWQLEVIFPSPSSQAENFVADLRSQLDSSPGLKRSSFSLFLQILSKNLQKASKNLANKIVSRIFAKLNVAKLVGLSERGLHNLVELLVALALSTDLNETGPRLMDIMLQLQFSKVLPERQRIVGKGHAALVGIFAEQQLDLSKYLERLMLQLKESPTEHITKLLAQLCQRLLRSQHPNAAVILGPWIQPYLFTASDGEKQRLFDLFLEVLKRGDASCLKPMFEYVLPAVKHNYLKGSELRGIPEIAAHFCIAARGTDGMPHFQQLFKFFGDLNRPNVKFALEFFTILLENNFGVKLPAGLVVQHWIRFTVILEADEVQVNFLSLCS